MSLYALRCLTVSGTRVRSNGAACGGDANTCQRAVCECDAEFAAAHAKNVNYFKSDYYTLSYMGNEAEQCPWIPTDHCREKMPGALPKLPCHPVTYKNYYAYHYANDYQGTVFPKEIVAFFWHFWVQILLCSQPNVLLS